MTGTRGTVFQGVQSGPETVIGTLVPATKRHTPLHIEMDPDVPIAPHRGAGSLAATSETRAKEHSPGRYQGPLDFNSIVMVLCGVLLNVTPTTPQYGTNTRRWTFLPATFQGNTPKAYTIELGSEDGAEVVPGVLFTGIQFRFTKEEAAISGDLFGAAMVEDHNPTDGVDLVPEIPIDPDSVDIFIADSYAGLGAGQIDDALEMEVAIAGRWKPVFTQDSRTDTWSYYVERGPEYTANLSVVQGSNAATYMGNLRSKTKKFCRIVATGPLIEGSFNYKITIEFAFVFQRPTRGDNDDVFTGNFPLIPKYDATVGGWIKVIVDNTQTSL